MRVDAERREFGTIAETRGFEPAGRREHRDHGAGLAMRLERLSMADQQRQRIVGREAAGHRRRDECAEARAEGRIGLDARLDQQARERIFDHEDRGMADQRSIQRLGPGGAPLAIESIDQRQAGQIAHHRVEPVHLAAKHRGLLVERLAHAVVLRALPGEQECDAGLVHLRAS